MDAAATLVWTAAGPPDVAQSRSLASWSRACGVRLSPPATLDAPVLAIDPRVADAVETHIERARDAIGARDGDAAERALSSAESMLRAHAELPQATWLMAEVERARATRWRRIAPVDPAAADRAWERAEALDGGRVAGVGEESSSKHPPGATLAIDLAPADAEAWLDGKLLSRADVATRSGLHTLVVRWGGRPVWANWIDVAPGASAVRALARVAPPCSTGDLARVRLTSDGAPDARYVECPAWVAATAGRAPGDVRIARCTADHCGPWLAWRAPKPWIWSPPPEPEQPERRAAWPAWATWGLAGAGVAVAAGIALVASGVLQPGPSETRFVSGGIRTQ